MNRKCNRADLDMDLVANVDAIRECYMKFATLSDSHRPLVIESSVDETTLWHLASACKKALAAITGDEDVAFEIYEAMGDSGESATYIVENAWMHVLYRAAATKAHRRRIAQYN